MNGWSTVELNVLGAHQPAMPLEVETTGHIAASGALIRTTTDFWGACA